MISYELLVANCELPFKEINLRVASYFLQAAVLKEWIYEFQIEFSKLSYTVVLRVETKSL